MVQSSECEAGEVAAAEDADADDDDDDDGAVDCAGLPLSVQTDVTNTTSIKSNLFRSRIV